MGPPKRITTPNSDACGRTVTGVPGTAKCIAGRTSRAAISLGTPAGEEQALSRPLRELLAARLPRAVGFVGVVSVARGVLHDGAVVIR